jgi:hypothetical protein
MRILIVNCYSKTYKGKTSFDHLKNSLLKVICQNMDRK